MKLSLQKPRESVSLPKKDNQTISSKDVTTVNVKDYTPPPQKNQTDTYVLAKKYVPKTERNIETWGKITAALAQGPKTLTELTEAVKDHKDFVGYMLRGGHIVKHDAK